MDTLVREEGTRGMSAPTSTGPAGDPREILLEAVTSLHADLNDHPDYHLVWLAGIDMPQTTSDQPIPWAVAVRRLLARSEPKSEAQTETQRLVEDLLTRWSLPAGALAEALSVSRQTIYLWRAGEEPKAVNAARLGELHRQVARVAGSRTGKEARKHLTLPGRRAGCTKLQEIARQVNRENPLPQPAFTALHYLAGTDVDLPVVARKPTIRITKVRPIKSVRSTK